MTDRELLSRIVVDPAVVVGKPVVRGTRLTVERILGLLAHGFTVDDVISEYPGLAPEDVHACLLFAQRSLSETRYVPAAAGETR